MPPRAAYRLRKFLWRNRGPVAAAGVVLLALLLGVAGTGWGLLEARDQRDHVDAQRLDAETARAQEAAQRKTVEEQKTLLEHQKSALEQQKSAGQKPLRNDADIELHDNQQGAPPTGMGGGRYHQAPSAAR